MCAQWGGLLPGGMLLGRIILGGLLLAPPALAKGSDPPTEDEATSRACVERTVAAVQQRYESIRDLAARFEQTSRSVVLGGAMPGAETVSRGSVVFAKPGKMRWAYEEPEPSLVVSDGEILSIYDPAHQELQRLRVGKGYLSGAAIQFLLGEGDILGSFEVTALRCDADAVDLQLVPREPATYEKLTIGIEVASGHLVRTSIVDLLGNETRVTFAEIETNRNPGDETFRIEPPDGVRVIELDPAVVGEGGR